MMIQFFKEVFECSTIIKFKHIERFTLKLFKNIKDNHKYYNWIKDSAIAVMFMDSFVIHLSETMIFEIFETQSWFLE